MKPASISSQPTSAPRRITILGATGSIGSSTLKVLGHNPERFTLEAVTAMTNVEALAELALKHKPKLAVIGDASRYEELKQALSGSGIEIAAGEEGLCEAAARNADVVLSAIVGAAGLKPTLTAIRKGTRVALANKECLVTAGEIMMREAARCNATITPVDSEHSAIAQVFDNSRPERVRKVTLTASGGPFRDWTREQMTQATPREAVNHPNWSMGAKISVDSATLMNKGLELIEAYHLFPLEVEQLDVLVHPESIVHCLVEYIDGSTLAQLCCPDMCTPIAAALAWPDRVEAPVEKMDLAAIKTLHFEAPDHDRFPALGLAIQAMKAGQAATIALNASNEIAVEHFLKGGMNFLDIVGVVERTLGRFSLKAINNLEQVLEADREAREIATGML